ncbi:MAG: CRTAC1 family protein, partial [Gammaproteobacteria bacterium]|nr:CRTAC1 family protein [Gammaproteobacteria bacterium]
RLFVAAGDGTFTEGAVAAGVADRERGYAAVCADFDNDGDVDIFQAHRNAQSAATFWRNDGTGNEYLRVRLVGSAPNTQAAGARIRATVDNKEMLREIIIGSNYTSQNPTVQIFGLGEASNVDTLVVEWPDGLATTRTNVPAGQTLVIEQPSGG